MIFLQLFYPQELILLVFRNSLSINPSSMVATTETKENIRNRRRARYSTFNLSLDKRFFQNCFFLHFNFVLFVFQDLWRRMVAVTYVTRISTRRFVTSPIFLQPWSTSSGATIWPYLWGHTPLLGCSLDACGFWFPLSGRCWLCVQ